VYFTEANRILIDLNHENLLIDQIGIIISSWAGYCTDPLDSDTDGDRMSDTYEVRCGVNIGGWQDPLVYNERFAVLISGRNDFPEFWGDLVILYDILRDDYGYTDENIYVLYADGSGDITDYPATKTNINSVFNELGAKMNNNDFLFIWTFDHGDRDYPEHELYSHSYLCVWPQPEKIKDTEFAGFEPDESDYTYLGLIENYARRVFFMQQCFSGGFIEYLSNSKTIIATACMEIELAWRCDGLDIHGNPNNENVPNYHGEFNYYFMSALHGETPQNDPINADIDIENGYISILEVFNFVWLHDSRRILGAEFEPCTWQVEHPQYDDNGDGLSHQDHNLDVNEETAAGLLPANGDGYLGRYTYI
jgi:hypothetical protein